MSKQESGQLSIQIETITPEVAAAYLGHNHSNRTMMKSVVTSYARDMTAGKWKLGVGHISFSPSGRLLDGQHRLQAIVDSGTTHQFLVARGVEESSQMAMDTGAKRSYSDHLRLAGEKHAVALAATVRNFALYTEARSRGAWPGTTRLTIAELSETLEARPDLRQSTLEGQRMRHADFKCPESVLAVSHRLLHDLDVEDAIFFFSHLSTGVNLFESGPTQPILRLRASFLSPRLQHQNYSSFVYAACLFKAWNAYREHREIKNVMPRLGGGNAPEAFPWPK